MSDLYTESLRTDQYTQHWPRPWTLCRNCRSACTIWDRCQGCPQSHVSSRTTRAYPTRCPMTRVPSFCTRHPTYTWLVAWRSGNAFHPINEVTLRRAGLILGWVTACGQVNHLGI